jgi:hypothetical protein
MDAGRRVAKSIRLDLASETNWRLDQPRASRSAQDRIALRFQKRGQAMTLHTIAAVVAVASYIALWAITITMALP